MKKINNKGFTLIEILAVIVIIAILGIVAIPSVLNTINNGKESAFNILVEDIKIGGQQMFEEIENFESDLPYYGNNDNLNSNVEIHKVEGSNNETYITINLQTLVSNGFLTGTNNEDGTGKVIFNPKTNEDIGSCQIKITKTVDKSNNYKTSYKIENIDTEKNDNCPTTEEYQKGE